jgi:hypothetical protein
MVHIKFFAHPCVPAVSPRPSPMASKDVGIVFAEHKESSTEWLDATLVNEEPMASTEVTSEQDDGSNERNISDDTNDSGNALDNGGHVKIGAEATLAGMSFDFGWSKVSKALLAFSLKDLLGHLA